MARPCIQIVRTGIDRSETEIGEIWAILGGYRGIVAEVGTANFHCCLRQCRSRLRDRQKSRPLFSNTYTTILTLVVSLRRLSLYITRTLWGGIYSSRLIPSKVLVKVVNLTLP